MLAILRRLLIAFPVGILMSLWLFLLFIAAGLLWIVTGNESKLTMTWKADR
jgi:hypothetical protein